MKQAKEHTHLFSRLSTLGLAKDRDYFIENLATLVGSGMIISDALSTIAGDVRSHRMKKVIASIKSDIEAGSSLSKALERVNLFSSHMLSLIAVGESSGKLSQNLKVVALEEAKNQNFKSKIRSALMYPTFVLGLTVVIGVGIAWFILPKLSIVFSQLHLNLPLLTRLLIGAGTFLQVHGQVAVPVFIIGVIILGYTIFGFSKTKVIGQYILFFLPGIKRLIQEVEVARFGYLLGTLLQAGLPVTDAIKSLRDATTFPHYKKFYAYLLQNIEEGNSFKSSFSSYPHLSRLIPSSMQQLIATSEQSGTLSETLIKVGATYEEKTEATTKDLTVILEPILLVIVWLGVVAVALAVILPIYSLIGGLSTS